MEDRRNGLADGTTTEGRVAAPLDQLTGASMSTGFVALAPFHRIRELERPSR